ATRSLALVVDDTLRSLVDQARAAGHTWAEIGNVLHVTRQAAFQRFGGVTAGREEDPAAAAAAPEGAAGLAVPALEDFLAERWAELCGRFDVRMRDRCPVELLVAASRKVAAAAGALRELGAAVVSTRHGYTVVDIPASFDREDRVGRVVLNADGLVSGLFVLPPDAV
ncbi:MAG TPA: hypothetical protein VFO60_02715, partial [Candidatus Dormibacteraeota bacterium]|nr:hypothetical protein [Candidatus Dormibacteraeota bacterium]